MTIPSSILKHISVHKHANICLGAGTISVLCPREKQWQWGRLEKAAWKREGKHRSGILSGSQKEKDWGDLCRRTQCSGKMTTWGRDKQENRIKTQLAGRDWRILPRQETGDSMEQKWNVLGLELKPGKRHSYRVRQDAQNPVHKGNQWTLPLPCSLPFFTFLPFLIFLLLLFFFSSELPKPSS